MTKPVPEVKHERVCAGPKLTHYSVTHAVE